MLHHLITQAVHEPICFGKEKVLTAREVTMAIGRLKSGKAAGEDEIILKMLKALNSEGNSLANSSVSSCVKVWQITKRMADRRDHPNIQER